MRTFIAIELDETIRNELAQVQARLQYSGADVKWVEPGNIHLTLKFLGEVSEEKVKQASSILEAIARRFQPFEITVQGIGVFPKPDFPRVVWAGLTQGHEKTSDLAHAVEDSLENIGFQRESRPFSSHLTIGRVRSPKNKAVLKEKILSTKIEKHLAQTIDSLTLFRSELTSTGPIYTKIFEAKLAG